MSAGLSPAIQRGTAPFSGPGLLLSVAAAATVVAGGGIPFDAVLAGMVAAGQGIEAICLYLDLSRAALDDHLVRLGLRTPHDRPRRKLGPRGWSEIDTRRLIAWRVCGDSSGDDRTASRPVGERGARQGAAARPPAPRPQALAASRPCRIKGSRAGDRICSAGRGTRGAAAITVCRVRRCGRCGRGSTGPTRRWEQFPPPSRVTSVTGRAIDARRQCKSAR